MASAPPTRRCTSFTFLSYAAACAQVFRPAPCHTSSLPCGLLHMDCEHETTQSQLVSGHCACGCSCRNTIDEQQVWEMHIPFSVTTSHDFAIIPMRVELNFSTKLSLCRGVNLFHSQQLVDRSPGSRLTPSLLHGWTEVPLEYHVVLDEHCCNGICQYSNITIALGSNRYSCSISTATLLKGPPTGVKVKSLTAIFLRSTHKAGFADYINVAFHPFPPQVTSQSVNAHTPFLQL